jgi:molecular chaperone HtpG
MSATPENHQFQAEVQQLLDLMIHSLYSNKDIFLRELISNASDALDKRRFAGVADDSLAPPEEAGVLVSVDAGSRTLWIKDDGIGMSREETLENLGTIARSGTQAFLKTLKDKGGDLPPELIGQFGVGFYASFMVADEVKVLTRRAGEESATLWRSKGGGEFSVEDATRESVGTTITLHLKETDEEDGRNDYTDAHVLRRIVKRYSDFVAWPVKLALPAGEDGETPEPEILNSMKALWTRPASEITEEEHSDFYKHVAADWSDPLLSIPARIEGGIEAKALLYVPSQAPFDLYQRESGHRGIHLYVKRVFIMDDCEELLPEYLRFVRGVVDAEDLSLNVSREILQQDRQVRAIRKFLVKKVLDELDKLRKDDAEKYGSFWEQFGPVLKEGMAAFDTDRERLQALLLFPSSNDPAALTSLEDYVSRMSDEQEAIYFATGSSREAVERSPHLEAFKDKGIEVLYLTDRVDEFWTERAPEFEGKKFVSVGKGEVELGSEEEKSERAEERKEKQEKLGSLLGALQAPLDESIKEVRLSGRLTNSPACLVGDEGDMTPAVEQMMRAMGQEVPKTKRILELNPDHPLLTALAAHHAADPQDPMLADGAHDPAAFAELLHGLLGKALGKDASAGND